MPGGTSWLSREIAGLGLTKMLDGMRHVKLLETGVWSEEDPMTGEASVIRHTSCTLGHGGIVATL